MNRFRRLLAEEGQALRHRIGFNREAGMRATVTYLTVITLFGIVLPWWKGVAFLDPAILGAYACFGAVFSGPASAADGKKADPLARIIACALYGESLALGMLFIAIVTVYTTRQVYVGPDLDALAKCVVFGSALSLAVSTIAVWISLEYSPIAARGVVRVIFVALLAGFYFRSRQLPAIAPWGTGIAVAAAALAYLRLQAAVSEKV
jgi:hypothetical protein